MSRMGPGRVVTVRLNPMDCISCIDIVDAIQEDTSHMSFEQVVRLALSSLLQTAREHKLIPEPDGYQFSAQVDQRFVTRSKRARSIKSETRVQLNNIARARPVIPRISNEKRKAKFRLDELQLKRDAEEIFSPEEDIEWAKLIGIVYADETLPTNPDSGIANGS